MKKNIIISIILSLIVIFLFSLDKLYSNNYQKAQVGYNVYLGDKLVGMIKDDKRLYNIIDEEQEELKNKYNVDTIYPPNDFNLVKVNTFKNNFMDENEVYQKIASLDNFMVKGYIITIKFVSEEDEESGNVTTDDDLIINVLDKDVFEKHALNFLADKNSSDEKKFFIISLTSITISIKIFLLFFHYSFK